MGVVLDRIMLVCIGGGWVGSGCIFLGKGLSFVVFERRKWMRRRGRNRSRDDI